MSRELPGAATPEDATVQLAIRTPKAAAVAGIAFSVLFTVAFVLLRRAVPPDVHAPSTWVTSGSKRDQVIFAVNLLPFVGIAFLWFIAVVRDQLGNKEDRFFATVFLGSGLLFIAMLFAAGAAVVGLLATVRNNTAPSSELWRFGRQLVSSLMGIYTLRMAAVFTAAATTLARRVGLVPHWLVVLGYLTALALLVGVGSVPGLGLLFPAWVFLVSVHILVASIRRDASVASCD